MTGDELLGGHGDPPVLIGVGCDNATPFRHYCVTPRRGHQRSIAVVSSHAMPGALAPMGSAAQDAFLVAFRRREQVAQLDHPEAWVRRTCAKLGYLLTAAPLHRFRVTLLGSIHAR